MRDNDEIHQCVQDGFCDGCGGSLGCSINDSWLECDGYRDEYDEIAHEWWLEDNPNRLIRFFSAIWHMLIDHAGTRKNGYGTECKDEE